MFEDLWRTEKARAEKAEARAADLERTAQCAEDMRDASDARVDDLEHALRNCLTALGQISDPGSKLKTELRNRVIYDGWKALGSDLSTAKSTPFELTPSPSVSEPIGHDAPVADRMADRVADSGASDGTHANTKCTPARPCPEHRTDRARKDEPRPGGGSRYTCPAAEAGADELVRRALDMTFSAGIAQGRKLEQVAREKEHRTDKAKYDDDYQRGYLDGYHAHKRLMAEAERKERACPETAVPETSNGSPIVVLPAAVVSERAERLRIYQRALEAVLSSSAVADAHVAARTALAIVATRTGGEE